MSISFRIYGGGQLGLVAAAILIAGLGNKLSAQYWTSGSSGSIYYSGNVGIGQGTAAPLTTLQVQGTLTMSGGSINGSLIQTESTSTGVGLLGASTYQQGASFWAYGQTHPYYAGNAYIVSGGSGTNNTGNTGFIEFANRSISSGYAPLMDILANGHVGIGTANPAYPLSVNGTVQAKEVLVNAGWSDYVFAPNYQLLGLKATAAYIHENRHLPDIPSEAEVKEKGVGLGEMQSKLLAKIEELTLHMIQAEERNDRLERQNLELQERITRVEARPSRVEGK